MHIHILTQNSKTTTHRNYGVRKIEIPEYQT